MKLLDNVCLQLLCSAFKVHTSSVVCSALSIKLANAFYFNVYSTLFLKKDPRHVSCKLSKHCWLSIFGRNITLLLGTLYFPTSWS